MQTVRTQGRKSALITIVALRQITWKGTALAALLIGAFNLCLHAATFSDANWASMGGYPGANGSLRATVVDGSGNLYIGGSFTMVGDVFANSVAKWNGTNWSPLGLGINNGYG